MKLVIDHLTRYGYDEEVKFSTQYLRLTPRSTGLMDLRMMARITDRMIATTMEITVSSKV